MNDANDKGSSNSSSKDFEMLNKLGQGSFGTVFKVKRRADKLIYVMKQINIAQMNTKHRSEAINEVTILSKMDSPYIVKYYDSFIEKNILNIVMEYCDGGDMSGYIRAQLGRPLNENKIWKFFIQMCLGLDYIHKKKILHRDIKTMNIFLTKDEMVRIGDLGVAKVLCESVNFAHTMVGTPYYLSPEMCEEKPYNEKSDVWALGCVLYEMCTQKHPFEANNQGALILKIIRGKYQPIPSTYSTELSEIVDLCLSRDYKKRPNVDQILKRPGVIAKARSFGFDGFSESNSVPEIKKKDVLAQGNVEKLELIEPADDKKKLEKPQGHGDANKKMQANEKKDKPPDGPLNKDLGPQTPQVPKDAKKKNLVDKGVAEKFDKLDKLIPEKKIENIPNKNFKPAEAKKKQVISPNQRPASEEVPRDKAKSGLVYKEGPAHQSNEALLNVGKEAVKDQINKERNKSPFSYRKEINQLQPQNIKEKIQPVLQKKEEERNVKRIRKGAPTQMSRQAKIASEKPSPIEKLPDLNKKRVSNPDFNKKPPGERSRIKSEGPAGLIEELVKPEIFKPGRKPAAGKGGSTYRNENEYMEDLDQVKNLPSVIKKAKPSELSKSDSEGGNSDKPGFNQAVVNDDFIKNYFNEEQVSFSGAISKRLIISSAEDDKADQEGMPGIDPVEINWRIDSIKNSDGLKKFSNGLKENSIPVTDYQNSEEEIQSMGGIGDVKNQHEQIIDEHDELYEDQEESYEYKNREDDDDNYDEEDETNDLSGEFENGGDAEEEEEKKGGNDTEEEEIEQERKNSMEENFRERYFKEMQLKLEEARRRERELVIMFRDKSKGCQEVLGHENFNDLMAFFKTKMNSECELREEDQKEIDIMIKKKMKHVDDSQVMYSVIKLLHLEVEIDRSRQIINQINLQLKN